MKVFESKWVFEYLQSRNLISQYKKSKEYMLQGMYKQVQDLSGNYQTLQEQVNGLVTAQQQYATQMTGGTAPQISGAVPTEDDEPTGTSNLVT